jgi:hypothetical protein
MKKVFEWDENKRLRNLAKHGLDFEDGAKIYFCALKVTFASRITTESRFLDLGYGDGHELLCLVYVVRLNCIRIISFRKASRKERKNYGHRTRF